METIDVKALAGRDIISRDRARSIRDAIDGLGGEDVELDFSGVEFTSRSFMDEFYSSVVKPLRDRVGIVGMSGDIRRMLDAVSRTQGAAVTEVTMFPYVKCGTLEEAAKALNSAGL